MGRRRRRRRLDVWLCDEESMIFPFVHMGFGFDVAREGFFFFLQIYIPNLEFSTGDVRGALLRGSVERMMIGSGL